MATTSSSSGPIHQYLDILSTWPTAIAIESQFFVYFNLDTVTALKNLQTDLLNHDAVIGNVGHNWTIPTNTVNTLTNTTNQNNSEFMGCVFAKEVSLPSESLKASNQGLGHFAGFQAPLVSDGRDPYKTVHITFVETNSSFIDFIIRPWIVTAGHYGMIARAKNQIKCDYVDVSYIGKQGVNTSPIIRKIIRFFNVVPISVNSGRSTYASDSMSTATATFSYDSYCVLDPNKGKTPTPSTPKPVETSSVQNSFTIKSPPLSLGQTVNITNPTQFNQDIKITNPIQFRQVIP